MKVKGKVGWMLLTDFLPGDWPFQCSPASSGSQSLMLPLSVICLGLWHLHSDLHPFISPGFSPLDSMFTASPFTKLSGCSCSDLSRFLTGCIIVTWVFSPSPCRRTHWGYMAWIPSHLRMSERYHSVWGWLLAEGNIPGSPFLSLRTFWHWMLLFRRRKAALSFPPCRALDFLLGCLKDSLFLKSWWFYIRFSLFRGSPPPHLPSADSNIPWFWRNFSVLCPQIFFWFYFWGGEEVSLSGMDTNLFSIYTPSFLVSLIFLMSLCFNFYYLKYFLDVFVSFFLGRGMLPLFFLIEDDDVLVLNCFLSCRISPFISLFC